MAIQQLDLKLDEMNQGLVDEQQREQLADAPMPEKAIDMPAAPMPSEEGIQVAGGRGELIGEVLKKLKNVEIRKPPVAPITPQAATAAAVEDTTKAAINAGVTASKTEAKIAAKVQANAKPAITQRHLPANVLKCKRSVLSQTQPQKYRHRQYSICQRWRQRKTSSQPLKP